MKTYLVSWGSESKTVQAIDENEAWSKFCDGTPDALLHPNINQRSVTEVVVPPAPAPDKPKK